MSQIYNGVKSMFNFDVIKVDPVRDKGLINLVGILSESEEKNVLVSETGQ